MAVKVVDASAIAALVFGEPDGEAVAEELRGHALAAPALLGFELANVCLKKMRRHPGHGPALVESFDRFTRMAIDIVAVDHPAALRLADGTGLTAHDAAYLWLARALDAELVTLDAQLAAAIDRK